MTNETPLALGKQLCFAMYSTAHAFNRLYKPLLERIGLTYPQYLVMIVLWQGDSISVKQLGERLMLDSGTLTPLLKRLEGMGLLTRQRSPRDERQVVVALSPEGHALRGPAQDIPVAIGCAAGLAQDQFESLMADILALRERLLAGAQGALRAK